MPSLGMWQSSANAIGFSATRVSTAHALLNTPAEYATGGFAATAVVADKHSRQAKPAAPPRGSR